MSAESWLDEWHCNNCEHTARELKESGDLSGEPPESAWCCGCDEPLVRHRDQRGGRVASQLS